MGMAGVQYPQLSTEPPRERDPPIPTATELQQFFPAIAGPTPWDRLYPFLGAYASLHVRIAKGRLVYL